LGEDFWERRTFWRTFLHPNCWKNREEKSLIENRPHFSISWHLLIGGEETFSAVEHPSPPWLEAVFPPRTSTFMTRGRERFDRKKKSTFHFCRRRIPGGEFQEENSSIVPGQEGKELFFDQLRVCCAVESSVCPYLHISPSSHADTFRQTNVPEASIREALFDWKPQLSFSAAHSLFAALFPRPPSGAGGARNC